ncbi:hypothetical protein ACWCOP_07980 [Maricaulaceae bacterium MS644]
MLTVIGLFLVAFGALYATAQDYLPFHAAAVPEASREPARGLYVALMTLVGGASGMLGVLGLFMTWTSIRAGSTDAAVAVSASYTGAFLAAAVTAVRLAEHTGAPTSWHIMGGLTAVTATGLVLIFAGSVRR